MDSFFIWIFFHSEKSGIFVSQPIHLRKKNPPTHTTPSSTDYFTLGLSLFCLWKTSWIVDQRAEQLISTLVDCENGSFDTLAPPNFRALQNCRDWPGVMCFTFHFQFSDCPTYAVFFPRKMQNMLIWYYATFEIRYLLTCVTTAKTINPWWQSCSSTKDCSISAQRYLPIGPLILYHNFI